MKKLVAPFVLSALVVLIVILLATDNHNRIPAGIYAPRESDARTIVSLTWDDESDWIPSGTYTPKEADIRAWYLADDENLTEDELLILVTNFIEFSTAVVDGYMFALGQGARYSYILGDDGKLLFGQVGFHDDTFVFVDGELMIYFVDGYSVGFEFDNSWVVAGFVNQNTIKIEGRRFWYGAEYNRVEYFYTLHADGRISFVPSHFYEDAFTYIDGKLKMKWFGEQTIEMVLQQ